MKTYNDIHNQEVRLHREIWERYHDHEITRREAIRLENRMNRAAHHVCKIAKANLTKIGALRYYPGCDYPRIDLDTPTETRTITQ